MNVLADSALDHAHCL